MEKPILFNTEMVQAILEGKKTVTRRPIKLDLGLADMDKNDPNFLMIPDEYGDYHNAKDLCKYQSGDILWVRETWAFIDNLGAGVGDNQYYEYKADTNNPLPGNWPIEEKAGTCLRWKPSIHMPREAARLFLKVTDVRVERLQNITAHECVLEGISSENVLVNTPNGDFSKYTINQFSKLWNSTVKKGELERYGWKANPWVWVIDFKRIDSAHSK